MGEVRESSVLQQPIKGVEIYTKTGELVGRTGADGRFSVQVSPTKGIVRLVFKHSDYETYTLEHAIDGRYSQTVHLPPLYLAPASEKITGRIYREFSLPEINTVNNKTGLSEVKPLEFESRIVEGEFNLVTHRGKEWLVQKLKGKGEIVYESGGEFYTIRLKPGVNSEKFMAEISEDVEFITPNRMIQSLGIEPEDEYWPELWNMQMLNVSSAWKYSTGSGVVVALLDTLYTSAHPDLLPNLLPAIDVTGNNEENPALNAHGLHVAGIIGAVSNQYGVVGVAPDVSILPIRVFTETGATIYHILKGIDAAIENGAQVINMSFGTYDRYNPSYDFPDLHYAIKKAAQAGILLVAAAGNTGSDYLLYPAAYPEVIAVGSVGPDGERTYYSSYGKGLELMAPGGNSRLGRKAQVLSTIWDSLVGDSYDYMEGTSMAAPHVSGVAALLIAHGIKDPDYIRLILRETARDLGPPGYDEETGYGLVDAFAALNRFQHTYVFFGSIEGGWAQLKSPVVQVEVNGSFELAKVRPGKGRVIGWIDVNQNLKIDAGDYLGQSEELEITEKMGVVSDVEVILEFIEGDFKAIAINIGS